MLFAYQVYITGHAVVRTFSGAHAVYIYNIYMYITSLDSVLLHIYREYYDRSLLFFISLFTPTRPRFSSSRESSRSERASTIPEKCSLSLIRNKTKREKKTKYPPTVFSSSSETGRDRRSLVAFYPTVPVERYRAVQILLLLDA